VFTRRSLSRSRAMCGVEFSNLQDRARNPKRLVTLKQSVLHVEETL